MPVHSDNHAALVCTGAGGCGSHQSLYTIIVDGEPVDPLIFLDFKNGVYTVDGVNTALSEMVAEETTGGGYGPWNEADIQAGVGLVGHNPGGSYPSFIGEAETRVVNGATCIYSLRLVTNKSLRVEFLDWPDFTLYYYSISTSVDVAPRSALSDNTTEVSGPALSNTDLHKVALTMIDGKLARSTDGGAVLSIDPALAWSVTPNLMVLTVDTGVILESIGIYPAQEDAVLPDLSAP